MYERQIEMYKFGSFSMWWIYLYSIWAKIHHLVFTDTERNRTRQQAELCVLSEIKEKLEFNRKGQV